VSYGIGRGYKPITASSPPPFLDVEVKNGALETEVLEGGVGCVRDCADTCRYRIFSAARRRKGEKRARPACTRLPAFLARLTAIEEPES